MNIRWSRKSALPAQCAIAVAFVSIGFTVPPASGQDALQQVQERAVADAVDSVSDCVVQIDTIGGVVSGQRLSGTGPFTGTVVSPDGLILTSGYNVAHHPASIIVRLPDDRRLAAEIVVTDESRNLVLLQAISDPADNEVGDNNVNDDNASNKGHGELNLPFVSFVDRSSLMPGETAIAVGRVYDPQSANVSIGIVSATDRIWNRAIQTDAKISPANYGGPLINLRGQVIGVLTPMSLTAGEPASGVEWYDSGIGFAADALPMLERVARNGIDNGPIKLSPGIAGIEFEGSNIYADRAAVAVSYVGSPAYAAGVRKGDVVAGVNGMSVTRIAQFKHAVGPMYAGDMVRFLVARGDEELSFELTLVAELPPFEVPAIGVVIEDVNDLVFQREGDELIRFEGVRIRHVFDDSPAAKAGLRTGDRIGRLGDFEIGDCASFRSTLVLSAVGDQIEIEFVRDGKTRMANLSIGLQQSTVPGQSFEEQPSDAKSELIPIKLVDAANIAFVIRPAGSWSRKPALIVWLAKPGEIADSPESREQFAATWMKFCATQNVAVLVISPEDDTAWDPGEADIILRIVDVAKKQTDFDRRRIAIGGIGPGAAMSGGVCAANRKLFSGLIMIDSTIPESARLMKTSAVAPLLLYVGSSTGFDKPFQLAQGVESLKAAGFPLHLESGRISQLDVWVESIVRWSNVLDRN